ncbi:MAG: membrane-bound lytic murein transglycosylase D [Candidatus Paceibacteria bacterium]|jgi:membrane-bound lytic murein transglycosylase D
MKISHVFTAVISFFFGALSWHFAPSKIVEGLGKWNKFEDKIVGQEVQLPEYKPKIQEVEKVEPPPEKKVDVVVAVVKSSSTIHTVKSGENLINISRRYNVTIPAIMEANKDIKNPNNLYIDQQIIIPKIIIPRES